MNTCANYKPIVLVLSAHDPSGGAGIQADIETLASNGCIAAPVITSLTAQNTQLFSYHLPQTAENFTTQVQLVLDDMNIAACKIGAIGSAPLIKAIHQIILDKPFPVILDPVLQSSTRHHFADQNMTDLLCEFLIPLTTVITPNLHEALLLTGTKNPDDAAVKLTAMGCQNILITDAEPSATEIVNHWWQQDGQQKHYTWERLPDTYHGSGCTLASAISAGFAKNIAPMTATEQAQHFTWHSLKNGLKIATGQHHPNRFFDKNKH